MGINCYLRSGQINKMHSYCFWIQMWHSGKERLFFSYCLEWVIFLFATICWWQQLWTRWKVSRFSLGVSQRSPLEQRNYSPPPEPEYVSFVALPWQAVAGKQSEWELLPSTASRSSDPLEDVTVAAAERQEFRSGVTPEARRGCCQFTCPVSPGSPTNPVVEHYFLP